MSDEKVCPRCAETVKAAAQVCRFCGYEFTAQAYTPSEARRAEQSYVAPPSAEASKKPKPGCLKVGLFLFGGLVVLGIIGQALESPEDKAKREAEQAAEKEAEATKEATESAAKRTAGHHCLSGWDGSHTAVKDSVKESMRNPDSFEHDETRMTPVDAKGKHKLIMKFRAENGFGGMNVGYATATIDNASCNASNLEIE